ncbi:MAG: hypothetical protein RLZZ156_256 [Deinococcota bacterium]|jgi:hypothetical protein
MNPVQSMQNAIAAGWQKVLDGVLSLNPVPEALRPILGSRYFWFLVWVAIFSSLGRNLLGERFGAWLGAILGGLVWASFMPKPELELSGLVLVMIIFPVLLGWFSKTKMGQRTRGAKTCPDCSEEIKNQAKVCKHCGFRFGS